MSLSAGDLGVVVLCAAAIGWVNWYFLFARSGAAVRATGAAVQRATVVVQGGYEPAVVRVAPGRPVALTFVRRDNDPCSEELVIPALEVRRVLPEGEPVVVEFTPSEAGRYEISCGMGMLHGSIVVSEEPSA